MDASHHDTLFERPYNATTVRHSISKEKKMTSIFNLFRKPSARVVAQQSLEEAERQLLAYQSQAEYAQQMVVYYQRMVARLKTYVRDEEQEPTAP